MEGDKMRMYVCVFIWVRKQGIKGALWRGETRMGREVRMSMGVEIVRQ